MMIVADVDLQNGSLFFLRMIENYFPYVFFLFFVFSIVSNTEPAHYVPLSALYGLPVSPRIVINRPSNSDMK